MRFPLCVVLSALLATAAAGAAPKFRSVWKTPEVSKLNFASKKIAALVITDDQSLQMSGEEALAKELNNLGVSAVTTYRFVPREEMRSAERARPWFEKSAVEGVVALRPVRKEKSRASRAVVWSGYYQEFWGYYGQGWYSVTPIATTEKTIVVVETLVYDLGRNRLVWAATSEADNPKNLQAFVGELVTGVVREMKKMKLIESRD